MKEMEYLEGPTSRYPVLEAARGDVLAAYEILRDYYIGGGKAMIAGSGGSCADSEHTVGELMKGFTKHRPVSGEFVAALKKAGEKRGEELASCLQGGPPVVAPVGYARLSIALLNDVNGEMIYVQQLYGYGKKGDVFMGVFALGNAENVMYAAAVTKTFGTKTAGFTGENGGKMVRTYDYPTVVPSDEAFKIQELHLPIYHALCLMLEEHFYEV